MLESPSRQEDNQELINLATVTRVTLNFRISNRARYLFPSSFFPISFPRVSRCIEKQRQFLKILEE